MCKYHQSPSIVGTLLVCVLWDYAPNARVRSRPGRPASLRTQRTGTLPAWASCELTHPTHGYACRLARPAESRTQRTGTLASLGVLQATHLTCRHASWHARSCGSHTQRASTHLPGCVRAAHTCTDEEHGHLLFVSRVGREHTIMTRPIWEQETIPLPRLS